VQEEYFIFQFISQFLGEANAFSGYYSNHHDRVRSDLGNQGAVCGPTKVTLASHLPQTNTCSTSTSMAHSAENFNSVAAEFNLKFDQPDAVAYERLFYNSKHISLKSL